MTSRSRPTPFVSAPAGWRVALAVPDMWDITVVPLVGWQLLEEGHRVWSGEVSVHHLTVSAELTVVTGPRSGVVLSADEMTRL